MNGEDIAKSTVHIDTSLIPEFKRDELAQGAIKLVNTAFAQQDSEERYQLWLKDRRTKLRGINSKKNEAAPVAPGTTSSEISDTNIIKSACNSQA